MNIIINGEPKGYPSDTSIDTLLESLDLKNQRVAMEINKEIVPRSEYENYILSDGDAVEIVRAIGGG